MSRVISLFLLASGVGCDKGSDSAGEGDADTDTDTDTDTDIEKVRYLDGTVHVVVTDPTGKTTKCDTTIDLTGEESSGACLNCDFELDTEGTVASEKGVDCDPTLYPLATLVEGSVFTDIWLGWSDDFTGSYASYTDVLWFGAGYPGAPGPYWNRVIAYNGTATYANGDLNWTTSYSTYTSTFSYDVCGKYSYAYGAGAPNYGGKTTAFGSLNCSYYTPYESWTFVANDSTFAYVSLDTVAPDSAFDPMFYIVASDDCLAGIADESFECTYPPPSGFLCPSVKMPVDAGETYTITVTPYAAVCDYATGDYTLSIDETGDPKLAQGVSGEMTPLTARISIDATSTITMEKETD